MQLSPVADNTLYESATGALSNGAGAHFFAGKTNLAEIRRGLLKFDVAAAVARGSHIDNLVLRLHMSRTFASTSQNVALHRVLADWGEGASDAPGVEGTGTAASTNDATWRHRFFNSSLWTQAGGDFASTASATTAVAAEGNYEWASSQMTADVQLWLDDPATQFGWLLKGNEAVQQTAKRFDSKENPTSSVRPVLIIDFTPSNSAPTDITLDNRSLAENTNTSSAVLVGKLAAVDADSGDTHTFALVSGAGSADNAAFQISGAQLELRAGTALDHETKPQLQVRVAATDQGGLSTEKAFIIDITNVNEAPTDITLDNRSLAENTNTTSAVLVGNLAAADPDSGDSHIFALVAGTGAADNAAFQINGARLELRAGTALDHETKPQWQIRLAATDQGGLSTEKAFTIDITDVNEAPTVSRPVARQYAVTGEPFQLTIPADTFADQDQGDTLTLSAQQANGAALPAWLAFDAAARSFSGVPQRSDAGVLAVKLTAADSGQPPLAAAMTFTLIVVRDSAPWQNPVNRRDVNFDGLVTPIDALVVINQLNTPTIIDPVSGKLPLVASRETIPPPFYDVTGDGFAVPQDVLVIINFLNSGMGAPEAEASSGRALQAASLAPIFASPSTWPLWLVVGLPAGRSPHRTIADRCLTDFAASPGQPPDEA